MGQSGIHSDLVLESITQGVIDSGMLTIGTTLGAGNNSEPLPSPIDLSDLGSMQKTRSNVFRLLTGDRVPKVIIPSDGIIKL